MNGETDKMPFNGQIDRRLFVCSLPKLGSGLCAGTWILIYSRSRVSVYRSVIHFHEED